MSAAFVPWDVTARRGRESFYCSVLARTAAEAVREARRVVSSEMPFYKSPFDAPCRVSYSARRSP